jgi:hypothetical protein
MITRQLAGNMQILDTDERTSEAFHECAAMLQMGYKKKKHRKHEKR